VARKVTQIHAFRHGESIVTVRGVGTFYISRYMSGINVLFYPKGWSRPVFMSNPSVNVFM